MVFAVRLASRHDGMYAIAANYESLATQIGLGVGGLFVSGLAAAVGFLAAGIAVGAAGKAWDDSPAGQDGALARIARAVAETSTHVPVVVIIDDADCLDHYLALTLIENLAARHNGHVLVVAAVNPGSSLQQTLVSRARQGITEGLVRVADANPDMSYESRADLASELLPRPPSAVVRRIARSTVTFADVFTITAAPRLTETTYSTIPREVDEADLLAVVDRATARLRQPDPSPEAVTGWAGGLLHARQAARALAVLGQPPAPCSDPDLLRHGKLERVTAPESSRMTGGTAVLAVRDRRAMAAAILDEAARITADPRCGLVERMAAAQAAHHVRADLTDPASRAALPPVQRQLAAALEDLGEPAAALEIAAAALDDWSPGGSERDREQLVPATLRLTALTQAQLRPRW